MRGHTRQVVEQQPMRKEKPKVQFCRASFYLYSALRKAIPLGQTNSDMAEDEESGPIESNQIAFHSPLEPANDKWIHSFWWIGAIRVHVTVETVFRREEVRTATCENADLVSRQPARDHPTITGLASFFDLIREHCRAKILELLLFLLVGEGKGIFLVRGGGRPRRPLCSRQ
jgi:hypothetical protein